MTRCFQLAILALALSACGGTDSRVEQYVIQSHPGVTSNWLGVYTYFVLNVNNTEDNSIRTHPCFSVTGLDAKWGTTYAITVEETPIPENVADVCETEKTLISIDGQFDDPVGTQYANAVGSFGGGLVISRDLDQPTQFKLQGYNEPIYCEEVVCGRLLEQAGSSGDNSAVLPREIVFELMEVDGQRIIGIVQP